MKKIICKSIMLTLFAFFYSNLSYAANINLPWSTTYNCAYWEQGQTLNCDNIKGYGGWTTSAGSKEQITSSANFSGGAGGSGQRHWLGDGRNNTSGGLALEFITPQPEVWIRWYERYEQGFQFNPLEYHKMIYLNPSTTPPYDVRIVPEFYSTDSMRVALMAVSGSDRVSASGTGWNTIMVNGGTDARGNKMSDGQWHCYEVHLKTDTNGSNGVTQMWVDGVQIINSTNVNYGQKLMDYLVIASNAALPANGRDMYVDYDDIAVSKTGYIGPIGGDSTPPSTPANLAANVISATQINLTWAVSTDNVGVTGYNIYRDGVQIATSTTTSYSNTGLTASTTYSYTVSAYDAAGNNSTQSTSASATTQALQTSTTLFQESFEDTSFASRGWYDGTTLKLSTTEKYSGNSSVEYHFLPGATKPEISGGAIRKLFTPTDEVYVSYWVKYSSNWTGSNKPYHPHEFFILTNENGVWDGPAFSKLTAYIEQNEGTPLLSLQDGMNIDLTKINQDLTNVTENRAIAGCNGVPTAENTTYVDCYPSGTDYWNGKVWKANQIYFQDAPGAYYKNNWHHVEGYFKLNTISGGKGQPDGIVKYWYDGNLLIEKTNIIMRTAQYPNMKFNQFLIAPWIGDGSPIDQNFWVDDLTLATSRPTQQDTTPPAAPGNLQIQ